MLACRAVFNGALIKLRNRFVFFIVVYFTRFFFFASYLAIGDLFFVFSTFCDCLTKAITLCVTLTRLH